MTHERRRMKNGEEWRDLGRLQDLLLGRVAAYKMRPKPEHFVPKQGPI